MKTTIRLMLSSIFSCVLLQTLTADQAAQQPQNPAPRNPTGREEIAFNNRNDRDLYRRYEYKDDWNYQQNWQTDPNAYLQGQNSPNQGSGYYQNNQDANQYNNYRYYNYPDANYRNEAQHSYNHESRRDWNWDYRDNWQYNPGPFLRGEEQSTYNEKRFEASKRKRYNNPQSRNNSQQNNGTQQTVANNQNNNNVKQFRNNTQPQNQYTQSEYAR